MALGDFQEFTDYAYQAFTSTLQQKVALFNEASRGAIVLESMAFTGDYKQKSSFENLSSLVGNRDASSTSAATEHALAELLQVDVKVGWGIPNISYTNTALIGLIEILLRPARYSVTQLQRAQWLTS